MGIRSAGVLAGVLLLCASASPQSDADGVRLFEEKIAPLLAARCGKCHGPEAPKAKGGLRIDTREALLKGGDTGPSLVPGKPDLSLLLKAVRWEDPDLQMPPKKKMPDEEIDLLKAWIVAGAPWSKSAVRARKPEKKITDADRAWWSFRPVREPELPPADPLARNEIDRFIDAKLKAEGLTPAPEADRRTLLRRLTFDLHGLPPTPEEIEAFEKDASPDAYEKQVERLLAHPRYGERWARHWLDLVRYAESDGYKQDAYRPNTWPYRDYVIRSFREDKPYDRFLLEQLAGDEIAPDDPDVLVATGFLRLGIYEYNQRDVKGQWRDILNDVTDVTGDAMLGLGMGCARCHDHKFDPILQRDYFALQSFFAGLLWRDDQPLAAPAELAEYRKKRALWEEKTAAVRAEIAEIEKPFLDSAERNSVKKFLPELQDIYRKPATERSPYESQIADLVDRQVLAERALIDGKIKGATRERWSALQRKLAEFDKDKPRDLPSALVVSDVGPSVSPTTIPGDPEKRVIPPAFLTVLGGEAPKLEPRATSSGRRLALARWLIRPEHPLTARVMVNRIWQHHFGRGLVATSNDYGHLGEKPSHPELLDWLASRFVKDGWSVKAMHRLIVGSAAYRRAAAHPSPEAGRLKDPEDRLLWKAMPRRLEAESVRDSMLFVSGEFDSHMGGPAVDPNLPRRSIYTKVHRNTHDPVLEAFDGPETFSSVPARNSTTTATQALLMINGRWPLERAQAFARRLRASGATSDADLVREAYRVAYGRLPSADELSRGVAFLDKSTPAGKAADLPLAQTMPDRGGQAARFRSEHVEDRLCLEASRSLPSADFTIEAVVVLDSLYDDAAVRVIASQWAGKPDQPGWSFGVTSTRSKHQPRNLILQLTGEGGSEVVASDLHLELHKTHYVAAAVKIGDTGEGGVTFYLQDLSDPEAPLRTAAVRHKVTGGTASKAAFMIGGRDGQKSHGWDGLIDECRLSRAALPKDQLLLVEGAPPAAAIVGYWTFEAVPGFFKEAGNRVGPLGRPALSRGAGAASETGLVDFCHVLLNSNEFLYVD
jgi:mono/diheme cytochrome c family protein